MDYFASGFNSKIVNDIVYDDLVKSTMFVKYLIYASRLINESHSHALKEGLHASECLLTTQKINSFLVRMKIV